MSFDRQSTNNTERAKNREAIGDAELNDAQIAQALSNFRHSVKAWSDAEISRPRTVATPARSSSWRLAATWALGCVVVLGGISGGLVERQHRLNEAQVQARVQATLKAQQAAEQQAAAAQKARPADPEQELAQVNRDVARTAPSAMEPLAQLMGEDDSQ